MFHVGMLLIIGLFFCLPSTKGFIVVSQHRHHDSSIISQARFHPSVITTTTSSTRCTNADLTLKWLSHGTQLYNTKRNNDKEKDDIKNDSFQFSLSSFQLNPFKEFIDMFSNWDDVIDDFLFKRMGNGEVFYGKRKYKPSGRPNTDGKYGGMGQTDTSRIQLAQEIKEKRKERGVRENKQQ